MDINLDHYIMTPWFSYYPYVTSSPYAPYTNPGQYTHSDDVFSLRFDQRPDFLHGSKVHGRILKPKAIRITNTHPCLNPRLSEYQDRLALHFNELRDRYDNTIHLGCNAGNSHGTTEYLSRLYASSQYSYPYSYNLNNSSSKFETDNIFQNMIRHQRQLIHFHDSSDYKQQKETKFDADVSLLRTSELLVSSTSSSLSQNIHPCHRARANPKLVVQNYMKLPLKITSKDSCFHSKRGQYTRKNIALRKLRHKEVNNSKQRSASLRKCKSKATLNMKTSKCLKADTKAQSTNNLQTKNTYSNDILVKDHIKATLESSLILQENNHTPLSKCSLSFETSLLSSKYILNSSKNYHQTDSSNMNDDHIFYSPQAQFPEDRKTFQCPQCRYITDRKNNLKRHVVTMHQESSKILDCCGVSFQNKAALRDHNAIFHRGGYRCQVCTRNFCRKALLRRHLTVHSGQKDFFCNICGYATSHKSNLERHQKVHTKIETTGGTSRKSSSNKVTHSSRAVSAYPDIIFGTIEHLRLHRDDGMFKTLSERTSNQLSTEIKDQTSAENKKKTIAESKYETAANTNFKMVEITDQQSAGSKDRKAAESEDKTTLESKDIQYLIESQSSNA